ncbi:hypothetical protein LCGC14_1571970 [marine sediment metagenome]|uniref:Uncharacterized protein n=1 Tax=marine sediment metagenome TaxID=412755 RepID=A0A0F9IJJ1_9ZZZZ
MENDRVQFNIRWSRERKTAWDKLAKEFHTTPSHLMRLVGEEFLACHLSDKELGELDMAEYIGIAQRGLLVQALETGRRTLVRQMAQAEGAAKTPTRASKRQRK